MNREEILKKAKDYLSNEKYEFFRKNIENLIDKEDYEELNESFYTDLSFGTGGLRGVIGGGTNKMNPLTVQKVTQGLANYINKSVKNGSCVIAYDSRNFSDIFALEAALTLCSNNIKTYLFSSLRPTPELSFAVRTLKATSGIVVTASHNPAKYNGYKVYWSDGSQVIAPHDTGIISEVRKNKNVPSLLTKEEAITKGLLRIIDKEIDNQYLEVVKNLTIRPEILKEHGKELKVAYTPLHGTGSTLLPKVLNSLGVEVEIVKEQAEPDGNFSTVKFPNPEEEAALKMVLDLGKKINADLVMGTDPDSDRLGIAVPNGDEFVLISGNQLGCLLADYIFSGRKERGTLPKEYAFINTIVTSDLQRLIAESYGAKHYQTLTGFKYIGAKIKEFEQNNHTPLYIFGGEESYGYLVGKEVRDKDAISAAVLTAELALFNRLRGLTILDHLNEIYERFGYFEEALLTNTFEGVAGITIRESMMSNFRKNPPCKFGGIKIKLVKDYELQESKNLENNKVLKDIDLPKSNVLQFFLEDGSIVSVRPSGTEPKIKFYISCRGEVSLPLSQAKIEVGRKVLNIKSDILAIMKK